MLGNSINMDLKKMRQEILNTFNYGDLQDTPRQDIDLRHLPSSFGFACRDHQRSNSPRLSSGRMYSAPGSDDISRFVNESENPVNSNLDL